MLRFHVLSSLFFSSLFVLTSTSSAKTVVITCHPADGVYRSQFDAVMTLEVDDQKNTITGQFAYSTKQWINSDLVPAGTVNVTGSVAPLADDNNDPTSDPSFDNYQLTNIKDQAVIDGKADLVTFALTPNLKNGYSSRALVNRDHEYLSTCTTP